MDARRAFGSWAQMLAKGLDRAKEAKAEETTTEDTTTEEE